MNRHESCELNADSLPKCLPCATLTATQEEATLHVPGSDYLFAGESAGLIQSVFKRLNGMNTVADLAQSCGVAPAALIAVLGYLQDESVLIDMQRAGPLTGEQLVAQIKNEVAFWRRHIDSQPCWQSVHAGRCTERQILGWGIEFYHYVDAANEYMAYGVAYCRESIDIRQKIAAQYAEEADHGEIFLQGLAEDGLPAERVANAYPLPSTRALINYLNEAAMENSLVYTAIFSLMQSDGENFNKEGLSDYYSHLISLYPFARGMFGAFLKHASIDAQLGHQSSLFENLYANNEIISSRDVQHTFTTIRQLVNYFILYYEYIFDYYGEESAQLPRRAPQVSDFMSAASRG